MAHHKYIEGSYYQKLGHESEELFKRTMASNGYAIDNTTVLENKQGRDLYVNGFSVDVKRRKSNKIHVELSLGNGMKGWLYKDMDYIAFHLYDTHEFLLVERKHLQAFIDQNEWNVWGRRQYDEELVTLTRDMIVECLPHKIIEEDN